MVTSTPSHTPEHRSPLLQEHRSRPQQSCRNTANTCLSQQVDGAALSSDDCYPVHLLNCVLAVMLATPQPHPCTHWPLLPLLLSRRRHCQPASGFEGVSLKGMPATCCRTRPLRNPPCQKCMAKWCGSVAAVRTVCEPWYVVAVISCRRPLARSTRTANWCCSDNNTACLSHPVHLDQQTACTRLML